MPRKGVSALSCVWGPWRRDQRPRTKCLKAQHSLPLCVGIGPGLLLGEQLNLRDNPPRGSTAITIILCPSSLGFKAADCTILLNSQKYPGSLAQMNAASIFQKRIPPKHAEAREISALLLGGRERQGNPPVLMDR